MPGQTKTGVAAALAVASPFIFLLFVQPGNGRLLLGAAIAATLSAGITMRYRRRLMPIEDAYALGYEAGHADCQAELSRT